MSRRRAAEKRKIKPDVQYNSVLLSKFINIIMQDGKKSTAQKIVYGALEQIEKKFGADPLKVFNDSLQNIKPEFEVTSVRVGGANYQVPTPVGERRGYTLASKWLVEAARKRSGGTMTGKLAEKMVDAINQKGAAVKKRDDTHKMAESNKAFSHLAQRTSRG